jgi:hypothetical protein
MQPSQRALVCAQVLLGMLTLPKPVQASGTYLKSWRSTYPDSTSNDKLEGFRVFYHTDKQGEFSPYVWTYLQKGRCLSAIKTLDLDGDGSGVTNLEQISANTQRVGRSGCTGLSLHTLVQAASLDINRSDYQRYGNGPISGLFN